MDSENIHSFQKEIPIPALDVWLEQDGHNSWCQVFGFLVY